MSGIKGLSISNADDYGMWTIHESNAPFPVTRHQFRMMCNKDILQLFSEDLNQSMSPLKVSYHYISSVTVSSSNTHPVCASCMLPTHVLLGHLDRWRRDQLDIPKRWNGITTLLRTIPDDIKSQNMFNFSVFPTGECQMVEYTWCFTTCGHYSRWFPGSLWSKKFI